MEKELPTTPIDFLDLSYKLGCDELLIQGAGGNTSFKAGACMWIKASGTRLDQALKRRIFTPVRYKTIIQNIIKSPDDLLKNSIIGENHLRPSIETTLHAIMPHKVVLHTHPVDIIALASQKNSKLIFSKYLKNFKWAWVPYAKPGVNLSKTSQNSINGKNVDILVLENHGLVVGGNSCKEAENLTYKIMKICKQLNRQVPLSSKYIPKSIDEYFWEKNKNITTLATDTKSFGICKRGVLYPDQAVFLGPNIPAVNEYEEISHYVSSQKALLGFKPQFIVVKDIGVLIAENATNNISVMLNCHANILRRINTNNALKFLSINEIEEILNLDAEKYRQSLEQK